MIWFSADTTAGHRYDELVELKKYLPISECFYLGRRESPADFSASDTFTHPHSPVRGSHFFNQVSIHLVTPARKHCHLIWGQSDCSRYQCLVPSDTLFLEDCSFFSSTSGLIDCVLKKFCLMSKISQVILRSSMASAGNRGTAQVPEVPVKGFYHCIYLHYFFPLFHMFLCQQHTVMVSIYP